MALEEIKLKNLPSSTTSLSNLETLELEKNELKEFPANASGLKSLSKLFLAHNKLKTVPAEFGELKKLEMLDLAQNRIESLPVEMTRIETLQHLHLSRNQLMQIPAELGNLKSLKTLDLDSNYLARLPTGLGNLSNLTSLNLRYNGLLTVPEDFGNLKRLLRLNLSENQLTTPSASFVNLRNTLRLLLLIRNPIADEGKNGNLGKRELRAYFGDRVMFKSVEKDREFKRISKETALRNVLRQPLHWNLEVLKSLLNSPVPACDYSEEKMLSVWESKFAALTNEGNNNLMTSYIRKLYNPGMDYERWPMTSEFVELTKSLLQGIFTKFLSLEVKEGQTEADVNEIISSNINGICEGIQFCPDRQISELRFAYRLLSGDLRDEEISVEQHVKDFIASRKEDIFDHVFTSHGSKQNVHVLTLWKLKLCRDLGFDFNFDSKIGSIEQDPFHNEPGNALEAFFNAFTPNIVISMLTDGINANKRVMCKVMQHIYQSNLPDSEKRKMLVGEDFETINISAITRECSEYLLTEFNILQRRRENSGTIRNFFKK